MASVSVSSDLAALSTANTFNDLARRAASKGSEMLSLIWEAGRVAKAAKESIPHGEWMNFVERHYDVDHRSVTRWIKFHEAVPEAKLDTVSNLTEGIKMIDPPKKETKTTKKRSDKGKPGGVADPSSNESPVADGPVSSQPAAVIEEPEPEIAEVTPPKKTGRETPSVSKLVDDLVRSHVGHIARGLTNIAEANGGEGEQFERADSGLNQLIGALQEMREGKQ